MKGGGVVLYEKGWGVVLYERGGGWYCMKGEGVILYERGGGGGTVRKGRGVPLPQQGSKKVHCAGDRP